MRYAFLQLKKDSWILLEGVTFKANGSIDGTLVKSASSLTFGDLTGMTKCSVHYDGDRGITLKMGTVCVGTWTFYDTKEELCEEHMGIML